MNFNDYVVRSTSFNKSDQLFTKERSFKSEAAREKFLDKAETAGTLCEVLAFSDSQ